MAAAVGVAEHGTSAVLPTVAPGGDVLDRGRIDLTRGTPTHPYHDEGSWAVGRYLNSAWARRISLPDALARVERVREAAAPGAREPGNRWLRRCRCGSRASPSADAPSFHPRPRHESPRLVLQMSPTRSCTAKL